MCRRALVILLVISACVRTKSVTVPPGSSDGESCLATCRATGDNDAVVECAAACSGAVVDDNGCARRADAEGNFGEIVPGCVESTHVRWRRIGLVLGGIALGFVVVVGVVFIGLASAPTH